MADNIVLNIGSGGDSSAARDYGSGVKGQRVLVQYGTGLANDVDATHPLPVAVGACATVTTPNVSQNASSVTLISSNSARRHLKIRNNADSVLHCIYGTTANLTTLSGFIVAPGQTWEMEPSPYTGQICGIWEAAGSGVAVMTETSP